MGSNIAASRAAVGMSRREFAEHVGVDQMLVYKWERGQHRPNDENLAAVAGLVRRPVSWFFIDHESRAA